MIVLSARSEQSRIAPGILHDASCADEKGAEEDQQQQGAAVMKRASDGDDEADISSTIRPKRPQIPYSQREIYEKKAFTAPRRPATYQSSSRRTTGSSDGGSTPVHQQATISSPAYSHSRTISSPSMSNQSASYGGAGAVRHPSTTPTQGSSAGGGAPPVLQRVALALVAAPAPAGAPSSPRPPNAVLLPMQHHYAAVSTQLPRRGLPRPSPNTSCNKSLNSPPATRNSRTNRKSSTRRSQFRRQITAGVATWLPRRPVCITPAQPQLRKQPPTRRVQGGPRVTALIAHYRIRNLNRALRSIRHRLSRPAPAPICPCHRRTAPRAHQAPRPSVLEAAPPVHSRHGTPAPARPRRPGATPPGQLQPQLPGRPGSLRMPAAVLVLVAGAAETLQWCPRMCWLLPLTRAAPPQAGSSQG
ncbi:hypothetical protein Vretimale_17071 [Volvox reticuliferus]|uniref:Uncharacterized protein n=1 Tax=Volvox reticuliferus TaxID=1737510 RepID=A0A8J4CXN2_9CHLO|nr:hypothetical protein Vretifemale_18688 [Volvox reticuliferus]GIM14041.1 hypothetical protein Vretimale_17071 [Volvox reticuliferus]